MCKNDLFGVLFWCGKAVLILFSILDGETNGVVWFVGDLGLMEDANDLQLIGDFKLWLLIVRDGDFNGFEFVDVKERFKLLLLNDILSAVTVDGRDFLSSIVGVLGDLLFWFEVFDAAGSNLVLLSIGDIIRLLITPADLILRLLAEELKSSFKFDGDIFPFKWDLFSDGEILPFTGDLIFLGEVFPVDCGVVLPFKEFLLEFDLIEFGVLLPLPEEFLLLEFFDTLESVVLFTDDVSDIESTADIIMSLGEM